VVFGPGTVARLGEMARELSFHRTLLVADPGLARTEHVTRALGVLRTAGVEAVPFHDFDHDPDSDMVVQGAEVARAERVDSLIGFGGGSSLDCAKGIAFLLACGGNMADYRGHGKATAPLPPMIGVPTTAGTGSEAQSYALISDARSHAKMACGDPGAAFRVAVLDPELTLTLPQAVTAVAGFDALSHAVESYVTTSRTPASDLFAREAWRLLEPSYERVLREPSDLEARGAMLLGAHWAGAAIEASMLGATHACANPLSARYGTAHGVAIALMLPHVVRWNGDVAGHRYREMLELARLPPHPDPAEALAVRLEALARAGGLPGRLAEIGVPEEDLAMLAGDAAQQWTGTFNPRAFDAQSALELYRSAFS
jgi:alcohol dehydrogenase